MSVEISLLIGERRDREGHAKQKSAEAGRRAAEAGSLADGKEEEEDAAAEAEAEEAAELEQAVEAMRQHVAVPVASPHQKSHGQAMDANEEVGKRVLAFRRLTAALSSSRHKWVMISYPWADGAGGAAGQSQQHALRVYMALVQRRVPVWMDILGGVSGDLNIAMATAVNNAAVVLPMMSTAYERSTSCRRELNFADKKKVAIVPMIAEPQYQVHTLQSRTPSLLIADHSSPPLYPRPPLLCTLLLPSSAPFSCRPTVGSASSRQG